jgi:NH3-dependent NAD+ synthetase
MGRGRSKAKQTRVARDLKYNSQDIDIERLAKELHGEVQENEDGEDFDPFAEGNYIQRK